MKSLLTLSSMVLTGALCCLPFTLQAQSNSRAEAQSGQSQMNDQSTTSLSSSDKKFVDKAAEGGLAEVELGRLAEKKATNADVKSFAQRMVHDHTQANEKLNQIATQDGISVPQRLSAKEVMEKARLEKMHGAAFDKAYMENQLQDHKKDIAEFEHESQDGQNRSVKHFAAQTLPTLQSHLRDAEQVAPKVNASTSASIAH